MKRTVIVITAAIVGLIGLGGYFWSAPSAGIEPMGDDAAAMIAWISLAVAIVGLTTSVVGLVQKFLELRSSASNHV
jgi:O-antigen/teichoic acid export membrane protein